MPIGVADVRGGEIAKVDLPVNGMDRRQMFAEGRQGPNMKVAIRRHIVAEEDQIAIRWKIVMEVIGRLIAAWDGKGRRIRRPESHHFMTGSNQ